ncbi:hypothetical protein EJB05_02770 [Eragrostis curvula]|uniref:Aminotransferase-like plant mobile domain-containing protein n=1 Tax=Eragrostis curvula TaxID=38414 RepID=A0A5J9WT97_9POAL|nr:hypothetical protein EJB05_02770 [Eragrostis curvula]
MESWIQQWVGAETDVHVPQGPYDPFRYGEYLQWFHRETRVRLFAVADQPVEHVPEITDTFATQPTRAFHLMTDTFKDIAGELEDLGSRSYDNPPRVEPRDIGAALFHLARRCRDALRCVSCTSTTDVQPRAPQRSPPLSTPASAPGSSRFYVGDSPASMPPTPPFMPTPGWNTGPAVQFAVPDYSLHYASRSLVHGSSYGQPDV